MNEVPRSVPRQARTPDVALGGEVVCEVALPRSWVQYPRLYGAFHGFAEKSEGPFSLCSCQQAAVENLVRLLDHAHVQPRGALKSEGERVWRLLMPPFASDLLEVARQFPHALPWDQGVCHRCRLIPPSRRWAVEMYAGQFKQYYGWYVKQNELRCGYLAHHHLLLSDVAPPEVAALYMEMLEAQTVFNASEESMRRSDREMQRRVAQTRRRFANAIENITRAEFGQRAVGNRWIAETQLAQVITALLSGEEVHRHYRPPWLEGLEIDIWIPRLQWAIEYQGQQHFRAIEAWGGAEALAALQDRDQRKRDLCRDHGVRLMEVDFTEPLTLSHIAGRLGISPAGGWQGGSSH